MKPTFMREYEQLGLNISYYRREKGLTQGELADLAGVSETHITRVENCNGAASLDLIFKISRVLEVTPDKLFENRLR